MDLFDRFGVKFVSVTQSLDTQNPMGRLLRNVLLDFAQFEREMTADRTRDKMYQRAQKGFWNGGNPPYGYKAENKRLLVDNENAERLRFMFHFFSESPSLARLRDQLHRRGWYSRSGRPWTKSALDQILKNPIYCGFNAEHIEQTVIQKLADLSQNDAYLKISVEELNQDLRRRSELLETEATPLRKRMEEIEQEISELLVERADSEESRVHKAKRAAMSKSDHQS